MGLGRRPPKVPMFPGDLPRLDHPLPRALDDASAARLLRAAQADRRMLVRVTVEMLLRTGLRVSEFTGLQASAVVLIGAGPWLHVPAGKLREDRYLPLHPQLVTLIDAYRAACVSPDNPLLLPRENGRPPDRHTVTRMINRAGEAAGLPHIHPHQLRHTLATQFQPRHEPGGHRGPARPPQPGHDPALRQDRPPHRRRRILRRHRESRGPLRPARPASGRRDRPEDSRLRREHHRMLGNGWCTRPPQLDCAFESICETCSYFQTGIEFRPALAAQHDDATAKHQDHRGQLFATLLARLDQDAS
jgi:hypothetical protein